MNTKLGPWPENSWETVAHTLVLEIIDFRHVPSFKQVSKTTTQKPYFEEFMGALQRQSQPSMTEPPIWLWICGSKEGEIQVSTYAHKTMFTDLYDIEYSNYWPASNERLKNCTANNRLARGAVFLIFLVCKLYRVSKRDPIIIPKVFAAPQTSVYSKPRKYNELEYWIDTSELQIELYLRALEMFTNPATTCYQSSAAGRFSAPSW
jgi:hypothetical protein